MEEIEASPLAAARRRYQDPPIVLEEINDSINDTAQEPLEDIESWPPNNFGRGQVASSFQRSSVSTGFRPKPITQWRLLGGAGVKPTKMGPKTKAKTSQDGKYILKILYYIN